MINPVSNNIPPEYHPTSGKAMKVDNNSGFSLEAALNNKESAADDNGVIYEHSSSPQTADHSRERKGGTFEKSLDKAIREQDIREKALSSTILDFKKLWNTVKSFVSGLIKNIRQIFGNLWDSKPLGDGIESINKKSSANNTNNNLPSSRKPASIDELEASRDEGIRKALNSGNKDEFRSLISENGKRRPAKNTSMLTTYDSRGKIVSLNPSDENKILHGDRGSKKF